MQLVVESGRSGRNSGAGTPGWPLRGRDALAVVYYGMGGRACGAPRSSGLRPGPCKFSTTAADQLVSVTAVHCLSSEKALRVAATQARRRLEAYFDDEALTSEAPRLSFAQPPPAPPRWLCCLTALLEKRPSSQCPHATPSGAVAVDDDFQAISAPETPREQDRPIFERLYREHAEKRSSLERKRIQALCDSTVALQRLSLRERAQLNPRPFSPHAPAATAKSPPRRSSLPGHVPTGSGGTAIATDSSSASSSPSRPSSINSLHISPPPSPRARTPSSPPRSRQAPCPASPASPRGAAASASASAAPPVGSMRGAPSPRSPPNRIGASAGPVHTRAGLMVQGAAANSDSTPGPGAYDPPRIASGPSKPHPAPHSPFTPTSGTRLRPPRPTAKRTTAGGLTLCAGEHSPGPATYAPPPGAFGDAEQASGRRPPRSIAYVVGSKPRFAPETARLEDLSPSPTRYTPRIDYCSGASPRANAAAAATAAVAGHRHDAAAAAAGYRRIAAPFALG